MLTLSVPWSLLLSSLRNDSASITFAAVAQAGSDAEVLVQHGLADVGNADSYVPPLCRHSAIPHLDFRRRYDEGLVGVACPVDPACWPGWRWVPRAELTALRPRTTAVLTALAHRNALSPIPTPVPPPFSAVGLLQRRGLSVPVVWLRTRPTGFELLCQALRRHLGEDGLVVLMSQRASDRFAPAERICVAELPTAPDGDLRLHRALDELHPGYRAVALADPTLDFDDVHVRLDSHPRLRHVVQINGHDVGGFRRSDVKFLRLLLLALARKHGANDGWVPKRVLCGGKDPKDHALERMRNELGLYHVPGLREAELRALVRTYRGEVRLAVPPENLQVDVSLEGLAFVSQAANAAEGARARVTERQREGLRNAEALLRACRELVLR